jgi:hypothetical protein
MEKDQIEKIREEMFEKFANYEKQKENEILRKQKNCFHTYTSFSRVSSDGTKQLAKCGKCGHSTIKTLK